MKLTCFQMINMCMPTREQAIQQQAAHKVVLFSSIAALTGPAGSSNYAAANALLDVAAEGCQGTGWVCITCLSLWAIHAASADRFCQYSMQPVYPVSSCSKAPHMEPLP